MLTTLLDLRNDVLDRADMENGGPLSAAQVNQRINAAIAYVYNLIVKARGDQYFEKDAPTITTVSGVQEYDLPADFLKVSPGGVWWLTGAGQNIPIRQYSPNESMATLTNSGWYFVPYGRGPAVYYRVRAGKIRFAPAPLAAHQVLLKYIPRPPVLAADGDPWDGFDGFEEAVKWHAAASCKAKQEADTAYELEMFKLEVQRLLDSVDRDDNEPPVVQWVNPPVYDPDY